MIPKANAGMKRRHQNEQRNVSGRA